MDSTVRLARLALAWTVLTILVGALVRATHSGAGCGPSWPACRGTLVPALEGATTIEFGHRVVSGITLLTVAWLVMRVWQTRSPGDPSRRMALLAGVAVLAEALIGAAIVLFEWVGTDRSVARAISVPLHLTNTFLLLGALTLTLWFLSGGGRLTRRGPIRALLIGGAVGLVVIAATGAVTALADSLYPPSGHGLSPTGEHFLTRLRIIHPLVALLVVIGAAVLVRWRATRGGRARTALTWLVVGQIGLGMLNIWLGAPVWIQLVHLLVADLIWIAYVWLVAQILSSEAASASGDSVGARQASPSHT
ncbi:MAG: COX15/CtaA family protein [Actinomycetota bacterium]